MLTDRAIKNLKPKEKLYRIADSHGLAIEVQPNGSKLWRYRFRFNGKARMIGLGRYPQVSLAEARKNRDEQRDIVQTGQDPTIKRKAAKLANIGASEQTFDAISKSWYENQVGGWSKSHAERVRQHLDNDLLPPLANIPITEITAPILLVALRKIENRGAIESARRCRGVAGAVLRHAASEGHNVVDVAAALKDALKTKPRPKPMASIVRDGIDEQAIGELLRTLWAYTGREATGLAIKLLTYTFVRSSELRGAKWLELNLDKAQWLIPAERMKARKPLLVPLSTQAVDVLHELKLITGHRDHCFPGVHNPRRTMSEATITGAMQRLGIDKETMTPHGFRAMASTLLNAQNWKADAIERQLAHSPKDSVRDAYNSAQYLDERVEMMQHYSDYLDSLRIGANVTLLRRSA